MCLALIDSDSPRTLRRYDASYPSFLHANQRLPLSNASFHELISVCVRVWGKRERREGVRKGIQRERERQNVV